MIWRWTRRIFFTCFALIITLLMAGATYQFVSTKLDEKRYPPLGEMVDVGGYKLHIHCTGEGGPTVVLDAGLGLFSLDWSLVQSEISKFTHVCSYDRAGNGWSEESPKPRTSRAIVEELHTLLEKKKISKPIIFVGHSFGGINAQLYAQLYPQEVAGLVLVDSSHEDQLNRLPEHNDVPNNNILLFLTTIGVTRLSYLLPDAQKPIEAFPDDLKKMYPAMMSSTKHLKAVLNEIDHLGESLEQLKQSGVSFGDKPLTVITAGHVPEEFKDIWNELQEDLASRSSKGKRIIAEKSDHFIPRNQPEIIVEAVKEMVNN